MTVVHHVFANQHAAEARVARLIAAGVADTAIDLFAGRRLDNAVIEVDNQFANTNSDDRRGEADGDRAERFDDGASRVTHPSHRALLARFIATGMSDDEAQEQLVLLHQGKAIVFVTTTHHDMQNVLSVLRS